MPDRCNLCCHQLRRNQLLMSPARAPSHRCSRRLAAAQNGWRCRTRQPPASRNNASDVPVTRTRGAEVLDQPPERDELAPRYPKVAARNVLRELLCHLHAAHCRAVHRQRPLDVGGTNALASLSNGMAEPCAYPSGPESFGGFPNLGGWARHPTDTSANSVDNNSKPGLFLQQSQQAA
jgi:hypothetical protein